MYRLRCPWLRSNAFSLLVAGLAAFTIGGCPGNNNNPVCGDNVVDESEECDDGNTADGDGCSSTCQLERLEPPRCGDGVVEGTEQCDEGGETSTCNVDCTTPRCGDRVLNVQAGEQCDGGGETPTCNADCTNTRCGDQIVNLHAGEQCDDGNTVNEDGCSSICRNELTIPPACGDNVVNGDEQCDGGGSATATCNVDCTTSRCGDGIVNTAANEQCDDGDTEPNDGCGVDCQIETGGGGGGPRCGDGVKNGTEQCDTGGPSATCNANCTTSRCGDGIRNTAAGEQCDDGNTVPGDGCGATCQNEAGGIPNDNCEAPIALGDGTRPYSNVGATTDGPDEPEKCDFFGSTTVDADIWYCYTATCTGTAVVSLCGSDYDTKLAVYDGCGCPTATPLACNDDGCGAGVGNVQSRVEFSATSGQSYMVRAGGYFGDQGAGRLTIGCNLDPCGDGSGDCFAASPTEAPGCGDADCCANVCGLDQFCCDVKWDQDCADEASGVCAGGGGFPTCTPDAGRCGSPDTTPGCDDLDCCNTVCRVDSYCCLADGEWDAQCVDEANSLCFLTCGAGAGDCRAAHATPGCNVQTCCEAICADDPYCCDTDWDATCAEYPDSEVYAPSCPR